MKVLPSHIAETAATRASSTRSSGAGKASFKSELQTAEITLKKGEEMQAVDVTCSESDVRDAIFGASAAVVLRSHATAEVLGRNDDRNPRFYYGTSRVTPKRDFWSTREGKAVKRNWSALQGELIDAFDDKADELVRMVDEVLEQRKELKAVVVKVGESLEWSE